MYREVRDIYESAYLFNTDGYKDALCKIGNKVHSDYRNSRGTQREYSSKPLNIALLNVF